MKNNYASYELYSLTLCRKHETDVETLCIATSLSMLNHVFIFFFIFLFKNAKILYHPIDTKTLTALSIKKIAKN